MNKRKIKIILLSGIIALFFSQINLSALAVYRLHEKIPGSQEFEQGLNNATTNNQPVNANGVLKNDQLPKYLQAVYKFGIAIVAILAVVMVAVGAFMYIVTSAGNASSLANAKEIISNALFGLILALLSWLILFIINPDLVRSSLNMDTKKIKDWVDDGKPDKMCQQVLPYIETGMCFGDKFCLGGECVYKKERCAFNNCHKDLADIGEGCGEYSFTKKDFIGKCEAFSCSKNGLKVESGKQCKNNGVCCFSAKYMLFGG